MEKKTDIKPSKKPMEQLTFDANFVAETLGSSTVFSTEDVKVIAGMLTAHFNTSCEIRVVNETPYLMKSGSFYAKHGSLAHDEGSIPDVAPKHTTHAGDEYVFEEAVAAICSTVAPTIVTVWEFIDVPNQDSVYAIVYGDIWTNYSNDGYIHMSHKNKSAKDWYDYMDKNRVDYGSFPTIEAKAGGLKMTGTLTNAKNGVLEVKLKID